MKKFLFWILTFLWIWLSFCSADYCWYADSTQGFDVWVENCEFVWWQWLYITDIVDYWCFFSSSSDYNWISLFWEYSVYYNNSFSSIYACCNSEAVDGSFVSVNFWLSSSIYDIL